jgi:hypothetical protein
VSQNVIITAGREARVVREVGRQRVANAGNNNASVGLCIGDAGDFEIGVVRRLGVTGGRAGAVGLGLDAEGDVVPKSGHPRC